MLLHFHTCSESFPGLNEPKGTLTGKAKEQTVQFTLEISLQSNYYVFVGDNVKEQEVNMRLIKKSLRKLFSLFQRE